MTPSDIPPVLVIGATGRAGREVVAELSRAGLPVRALTRRPTTPDFPPNVEPVAGDLTVPESIERAADGARAVFLVWTASPTTAPAVVAGLARRVERIVFLSSPHRTPHPFFQQPNAMAATHAELDRLVVG